MINKLVEKIQKTNAPIVVGLDPMLNYIPQHILSGNWEKLWRVQPKQSGSIIRGL